MPTRRSVLASLAAGAAGLGASRPLAAAPIRLAAVEGEATVLGPGRPASRVWRFVAEGAESAGLFPVLRARAGERLAVTLENRLPQHTSIHWHGVRVPNAMDGVPYLTQAPVNPGESFAYAFDPPDPGTYFLHPHCNESGQSGRGLLAVLVVEGDAKYAPDADLVVAVKDWRLAPDGAFLPFETREGAGRAGTFGTVRGVNGLAGPMSATVPAGGEVRLRCLNLDGTRILRLGIEGAEAAAVAADGHAMAPVAVDEVSGGSWRIGPGMRVDLLARAPARAGETLRVVDYGAAEPWTLATLTVAGEVRARKRAFDPAGFLRPPGLPRARVEGALRLTFAMSATAGASLATEVLGTLPPDDPLAAQLLDSLCVRDASLWAINKATWPTSANAALPPPLGTIAAGRTVVFELVNVTPHPHPIHLHGHVFEVLSTSRQRLPRHFADTVILDPRERAEIAFVAAPGDWMLHCHILEHLEYGMMGYVRVA